MWNVVSMEVSLLKTTNNKHFHLNSIISKKLFQESCIENKSQELPIYYYIDIADLLVVLLKGWTINVASAAMPWNKSEWQRLIQHIKMHLLLTPPMSNMLLIQKAQGLSMLRPSMSGWNTQYIRKFLSNRILTRFSEAGKTKSSSWQQLGLSPYIKHFFKGNNSKIHSMPSIQSLQHWRPWDIRMLTETISATYTEQVLAEQSLQSHSSGTS